jgi:antitoxin component HigA of HigAB toxin-antitoxin module
MGEDMPIELRPKDNYHIYNVATGEIIETIWDIQYALAMAKVQEYYDNPDFETVPLDCIRFTIPATQDEEITYTNIETMPR